MNELTQQDKKYLDALLYDVDTNPSKQTLTRLCGAILDLDVRSYDLEDYAEKVDAMCDKYGYLINEEPRKAKDIDLSEYQGE